MVRRRRKTSRRFNVTRNVMKRRLGLLGWGNSRPFFPWSRSLTTRTLGEGHNPGTIAGAFFHLPVNNWNDPLGSLANLVAGGGSLVSDRHPMHHNNALSIGYNRVQVLSWKAELMVNWIAGAIVDQDYNVAYTFAQDAATNVTLAAGTTARAERLAMETNPMWTIRKFNGTPGVTGKRVNNKIVISVPNVFAYCKVIADGQLAIEANNGSVAHAIADVAHTVNPPPVALFCTVVIYTESGKAMAVSTVHVTVAITQRVKIMRDLVGSEDLDEGSPDVHA